MANKVYPLTDEQRQEGLRRAKEMRIKRMELKAALYNQEVKPQDVINTSDDPVIDRMRVKDFLRFALHVTKFRSEKIMAELEFADTKRMKRLGKKQREALIEYIENYKK